MINRQVAIAMIAVLALLAMATGTASAAKNQRTVIEDPGRISSPDPAVRAASLDDTKALGADLIKIPVTWRTYAPDGDAHTKPAVDLSKPDSYPAGTWDVLDSTIDGAHARGLKVWLMITAPAPRWAVRKESSPGLGAYLPDADAYGDFVKAIGRRYASVHYFSFWNEVNIKRFMQPQRSRGVVQSAIHYRDMYRAGYNALRKSKHARDTILFGELMPRSQVAEPKKTTRPIAWLREFFCLDSKGRALRGRTATRHKCRKFKRIKVSGLAYHPYNFIGGPLRTERVSKDNAALRYLPRVERVLDQAYKARHLTNRKLKIYNSEFGFQTDPPDETAGYPMRKVPYYLNVSEYMTWRDPRVATYSQYLIVDDPHMDSFQTGLRFVDGAFKPQIYDAFKTPLMVIKGSSSSRISVWGCLRGKPSGTVPAELQRRDGEGWTKVKTIPVSSKTGYFMQSVRISGATKKTFRVTWADGTSRSSRPGSDVRMRKN